MTTAVFRIDEVETFLNFHDSIYFVIVSLLTIGYGDINPTSPQSQLVVFVIIGFTIMVIPHKTSELLRLKSLTSEYRGNIFKGQGKHIVVSGNIQLPSLKTLITELFHEDHG